MAAATGVARVEVQVTDCFLLAHDDFMQRTRQGRHVSQWILELDRPPDLARLRPALVRLVQKHPLLVGGLCRGVDVSCDGEVAVRPVMTWNEKIKKTKAAIFRREDLAKVGGPSLSGPRPRRGRGYYQVLTLSVADFLRTRRPIEHHDHVARGLSDGRGAGVDAGPRAGGFVR